MSDITAAAIIDLASSCVCLWACLLLFVCIKDLQRLTDLIASSAPICGVIAVIKLFPSKGYIIHIR